MAKSILEKEKKCWKCGALYDIEEHHIFPGGCRKLSEKYGLKVHLCHKHHNEPPEGVHFNREEMEKLQRIGQTAAMKKYGWSIEDFIRIFGRNYL